MASAQCRRTLRASATASASAGSRRRSISTACTVRGRAREGRGQHPEPGADLQHDVARADARLAHGQVDQVLVEQEVLAELGVGAQAVGRQQPHDADPARRAAGSPGEDAGGVSVVSSSRASSVTPRSAGDEPQRVGDVGRAVGAPAARHRREVGAVGLHEQAARRAPSRAAAWRSVGLRVGHLAGEAEQVAALRDLRRGAPGARSSGAPPGGPPASRRQHVERLVGRVARVDHQRQPGLAGEPDLSREGAALRLADGRGRGGSRGRTRRWPPPRGWAASSRIHAGRPA